MSEPFSGPNFRTRADQRGSGAYEDWIAKLAASGANYIRAWMPEWDMGLLYEPVWQLPEIDFVQLHRYQIHSLGLVYPVADTIFRLVDRMAQYGKPVLLAEAGVDIQGLEENRLADPEGEGFHDLLWAGAFSGAFGSGMVWWWDLVIDPEDWYFHFTPLARLTEGYPSRASRCRASGGCPFTRPTKR